jgi:hypothetical protein
MLSAPRAFAIAPSDTAPAAPAGCPYAQRLFVGGAGNVKITTPYGDVVTYTGVLAGTYLYVEAVKVLATGTTATNIVGEYIRAM